MVLSLTPAAVLAVMNRGITSSIVELELVFTMRFLAIMGHPASFKNGRGGRVSDRKLWFFEKVKNLKLHRKKIRKNPEFKRIQDFW